MKPLSGDETAVVLLNRWHEPTTMQASAQKLDRMRGLNLPEAARYRVRDLWAHETETTGGESEARGAPNSVAMFRVSAADRRGTAGAGSVLRPFLFLSVMRLPGLKSRFEV